MSAIIKLYLVSYVGLTYGVLGGKEKMRLSRDRIIYWRKSGTSKAVFARASCYISVVIMSFNGAFGDLSSSSGYYPS